MIHVKGHYDIIGLKSWIHRRIAGWDAYVICSCCKILIVLVLRLGLSCLWGLAIGWCPRVSIYAHAVEEVC